MRTLFRSLLALLLVAAFASPAFARLAGDTEVPFSADRTVTFKGKIYVGRVYAAPGKQRHEQDVNGLHPVLILRADRQIAYLMLPELHIYTELAFPKAVTEYGGAEQLGKPVGEDRIAGQKVVKYRVEREGSDGSMLDGWVWMTPDGIVMKLDGTYTDAGHKPTEGTLELSNVKPGPQDPSLFEVPPDMKELPPDTVQALFNLRLPKFKH